MSKDNEEINRNKRDIAILNKILNKTTNQEQNMEKIDLKKLFYSAKMTSKDEDFNTESQLRDKHKYNFDWNLSQNQHLEETKDQSKRLHLSEHLSKNLFKSKKKFNK
mmetsp:Transcript_10165/g.8970  ORF Transcript_10165/g.8970 Transcript_10165/m.8970 type:complete len:107 (+) Transcript_10165:172-492(+)